MNIAELNTLPRDEVRRFAASVSEGQGRRFAFQHRLADGTVRDVDIAATRVQFGGRAILHSIVQDVTARKRAEQVLRENERHLSAAQAQAHLGSWSWDQATNRTTWSAENHAILGYLPGAVEPTQELFTAALHPEDRARVLAAMAAACRDGRPYEVECRIVRPAGEVRFVQCRGEAAHAIHRRPHDGCDLLDQPRGPDPVRQRGGLPRPWLLPGGTAGQDDP